MVINKVTPTGFHYLTDPSNSHIFAIVNRLLLLGQNVELHNIELGAICEMRFYHFGKTYFKKCSRKLVRCQRIIYFNCVFLNGMFDEKEVDKKKPTTQLRNGLVLTSINLRGADIGG